MNILDYLGKFHPLAVHLPIGILAIILVLGLFVSRKIQLNSLPVIKLALLVSAFAATASGVSGYLLSISNSYDPQLVSFHKWSGISLALLNWLLYFRIEYLLNTLIRTYRISLLVTLIALTLTGHAGGSLTHGSEYLVPPPISQWFSSTINENINISMNTVAFEATSIILEKKCFVCHGKNKQKGELRLDSKEAILKGGENGKVISGNISNNLLIQRIQLPPDDEDHMPPKEKKQLSKTEISFLTWWIKSGADFERSLGELNLPDSLHAILSKEEIEIIDTTIPKEDIAPANEEVLEKLRSLGVIISPLGEGSNYLTARFTNILQDNLSEAIDELIKLNMQIVWLNMDYQKLEDPSWQKLGKLTKLRKFSARNSNLDDESLTLVRSMVELVNLNLVGTLVTAEGMQDLKDLQKLESIYLYLTGINQRGFESLGHIFPNAMINSGNYIVPVLESDTIFLEQ